MFIFLMWSLLKQMSDHVMDPWQKDILQPTYIHHLLFHSYQEIQKVPWKAPTERESESPYSLSHSSMDGFFSFPLPSQTEESQFVESSRAEETVADLSVPDSDQS